MSRGSTGIAWVGLPTDIDRSQYIDLCYKTRTVSLRTPGGGFHNRVPISESDLALVEFPIDVFGLGSPVAWIWDSENRRRIITAVYSTDDTLGGGREGLSKVQRTTEDTDVSINVSAKERYIGLSLNTKEKGVFYVNVTSKEKDAKIRLNVTGDVEVTASGNITLQGNEDSVISSILINKDEKILSRWEHTKDSISLVVEDGQGSKTSTVELKGDEIKMVSYSGGSEQASFVQTPSGNEFTGNMFQVGQGTDPMILGNKLKSWLQTLVATLSSLTTTNAVPGQPCSVNPGVVIDLQQQVAQLDVILSQKNSLD